MGTPLGGDVLLLAGFNGTEAISQLFSFELDLVASNDATIPFDQLIGQQFTVSLALPNRDVRYFSGICASFSEGARSGSGTMYQAELVPSLWLLSQRQQSRIFQQKSVPDILQRVLADVNVSFQLQGSYQPRNYCVQYRESDFDFASRLMEEEGIYYFFTHSADGHQLVIADTPQSHPDMPAPSTVTYDPTPARKPGALLVNDWLKTQTLTSGRVTLWDHTFLLPQDNLEADATIQESAVAGQVTHLLHVAGNDTLEIYDYPGEYAKRFDGVDPGGGILADGQRTAGIRMQEVAAQALTIAGGSSCSNFVSGYRFSLAGHPDGNGPYVLTSVQHTATVADPKGQQVSYSNRFSCIPFSLPFRPARKTPKAFVRGAQTAVVTGPAGEQIYTDKYGRVKVQFFWDRDGKKNENSSCWIRVGALHAGTEQGFVISPLIGQEVIVDFLEGDPDQPIIVGSVYNADHVPPRPTK